MLYMVFFLLCDGGEIGWCVCCVLLFDEEYKNLLFVKFMMVVCVMVKGNIVVVFV